MLSQAVLPNNTVIGYTYDANNRRIAKKVNGVITERFIYFSQLRPAARVNADSSIAEFYVYGTKENIPEYVLRNGTKYRIITDHLGSLRFVVDASDGTIKQKMAYDEFGIVTEDYIESGFEPLPFGYAGGLYNRDTQLVKFGARDYDPEIGRWISKEPLGFAGSNNFYSYVNGDPVNFVDVTGLVLTPMGTDEEKKKIKYALMKLSIYSPTAKDLISILEAPDMKEVKIQMGTSYGHYNGVVTWSEINNNITEPWEVGVPSEIWLAHELIHALHYIREINIPPSGDKNRNQKEEYFTTGLDCSSYPFTENRIRKDYMRYYPELIFRNYYYKGDPEYEKNRFNPTVCY